MRSDVESARRRATALIELVEPRFPFETAAPLGPADAWPLVAHGLLAHATKILRSLMMLPHPEDDVDGGRLLRSLADHVITFAWLAAEPSPERLVLWRKEDLIQRLKADSDFRELREPLFDDRKAMQADVDRIDGAPLDLAAKAIAADKHWCGRIADLKGHTETRSFRGVYAGVFRFHSGLVHATMRGLNHVTVDVSPTLRRIELNLPLEGPLHGFATVAYALALLVAADRLGWPDADDVEAVFARFPPK